MTAGSIEEIVYNRQIYKQQQFHTAMHGPGEKRLFEGVQDRKDMQGELFGISNLFQVRGRTVVVLFYWFRSPAVFLMTGSAVCHGRLRALP